MSWIVNYAAYYLKFYDLVHVLLSTDLQSTVKIIMCPHRRLVTIIEKSETLFTVNTLQASMTLSAGSRGMRPEI